MHISGTRIYRRDSRQLYLFRAQLRPSDRRGKTSWKLRVDEFNIISLKEALFCEIEKVSEMAAFWDDEEQHWKQYDPPKKRFEKPKKEKLNSDFKKCDCKKCDRFKEEHLLLKVMNHEKVVKKDNIINSPFPSAIYNNYYPKKSLFDDEHINYYPKPEVKHDQVFWNLVQSRGGIFDYGSQIGHPEQRDFPPHSPEPKPDSNLKFEQFKQDLQTGITQMTDDNPDSEEIDEIPVETPPPAAEPAPSQPQPLPTPASVYNACGVCLMDYSEINKQMVINCGHTFCNVCLKSLYDASLMRQIKCPLCRRVSEYESFENVIILRL